MHRETQSLDGPRTANASRHERRVSRAYSFPVSSCQETNPRLLAIIHNVFGSSEHVLNQQYADETPRKVFSAPAHKAKYSKETRTVQDQSDAKGFENQRVGRGPQGPLTCFVRREQSAAAHAWQRSRKMMWE